MHSLNKSMIFNFIAMPLGLIITIILPILILSPFYGIKLFFIEHHISIAIIALLYLLTFYSLKSFLRYPGYNLNSLILPITMIWGLVLLSLILFFRPKYSISLISIGIITVICYLYIYITITKYKQKVFAYIDSPRIKDLLTLNNINWIKLSDYELPKALIDALVVDLHDENLTGKWQKFLAECTLSGILVLNVGQLEESLTGRIKIKHLYENELGSLLPSPIYLKIKYLMDLIIIIFSLPIIIPIFIITSIMIKLESKGPIFFKQKRIGYKGKEFTIYKFRSMYESDTKKAKFAKINDSRITRVGKLIRKTRIDELPQFINIIKNEMSLIGPRPEQKEFVEKFTEIIPFYEYRHIVKPGISGWAQVIQGYADSTKSTQIKIEHDFYYIKYFSFSLDIIILLKTIKIVITGLGAR